MRRGRTLFLLAIPVLSLSLLGGSCGSTTPSPSPSTSPSSSPSASPTPVTCAGTPSTYARTVSEWWIPRCSLDYNIYNDPQLALGPPDAAGFGPESYTGFVSLGFGGRVTLDLGGCLRDRPGNDLRVFQAVSSEPVNVYVSASPDGPFTLLEGRKRCGERINAVQGYCDFDFADGRVTEARYVRVEDGEIFPCPGGTRTEGADLDAVGVLGGVGAADTDPRPPLERGTTLPEAARLR
jgi:hypothetical protein